MGLEQNGFEVDTFNDPVEALSNFKANFYDMLLLDIRMPKMSGFELYDRLRSIDSKVKVCYISAYEIDYEKLRETFPMLTIDCYLRKPIEINDLVKRVKGELDHDK
jgi:DNA-binding response OmpR family regulator